MITISHLLKGRATLDQHAILGLADIHVYRRNPQGMNVGRYYAGPLNEYELKYLTLEPKHAPRQPQQ